ncbi:hypothetical protein LNP74_01355 [Klebsiella pneumoniae subsp. pneumoniae]|nr:hypothetical protein [Klebsiella pneumoniae subsp. pneumoniae]
MPFAWARAHHLVLLSDGECCEALCRSDTAARALLEARRLADRPDARQPSGAGRVRESAGAQLSA